MAIAWPIPELPPVTTATLSCSPFMVSSSWGWPRHGQDPGCSVSPDAQALRSTGTAVRGTAVEQLSAWHSEGRRADLTRVRWGEGGGAAPAPRVRLQSAET